MKKLLFTFIAFSLMTGASCQKKADIEKEKEAIKAVIEEEIALYLDRDYKRESKTWKEDSYVRMIRNFGNNHDQIVGWDNILAELKKGSEEDWSDYHNMKSESKDFYIKVFGETAWAVFYQQWTGENKGVPYDGTQSRVYFLEKVDDNWKIALMTITTLDPCETGDEELEAKTEDTE